MAEFLKKNKFKVLAILISLICCVIVTFFWTNYNSIRFDSNITNYDLSEIQTDDFDIIDGKLVAKTDNPSFEINVGKYVNKIKFTYEDPEKGNIVTNMYYNEKSEVLNNSGLTNLFVERINRKTESIRFQFDQKLKISDIRIDNSYSFNFYIFFLLFTISLVVMIFNWHKDYFKKNINKLFLLIAIPLGLLIIFESAPFVWTGLDDDTHFGVTYQLLRLNSRHNWSKNAILSRTGCVNFLLFDTPEEIVDGVNQIDKITELTPTDRSFPLAFWTITYLPASLMMNLSLGLGASLSVSILLARIVNLFIYIFAIYLAIKVIPKYKHLLAVIALLPTSLFSACQFSYDSKVNAFLILMVALIIRELLNKDEKITWKSMTAIIISGLIGASAKGIYIVLILPALAISKSKFKSKKECYIFRILILLSIVFIFNTFMGVAVSSSDTRMNSGANGPAQIQNIIQHPTTVVKAFYNSAGKQFFYKFFGDETLASFASYGTVISSNVYFVSLIVLLVMVLNDIGGVDLKLKDRITILISCFLLIGMIWGALYVSFTAVGAEKIDGVQGRYFIALLLPLLICLSQKKKLLSISDEGLSKIMLYSSLFTISVSIFVNIITIYCL